MACIALKPIVDELEAKLTGRLVVVRLNIQDAAHKEIVEQFRVRGTPTFILLDAGGTETWRSVGALDPQAIQELVGGP